jgi:Flp pilus assembly pilin Flp
MKQSQHRLMMNRRGQALVEFALVAILLLVLIIGVFEFGRALNAQQVITLAAREGARRAVIADPTVTQAQIEFAIREAIHTSAFDPDSAVITFPCFDSATGSETGGECFKEGTGQITSVRVALPYRFPFLTPLIAIATGSNGRVTLETVARFRNE